MPWLADLVETNEGSWSLLPVQCLCEFLLHEAAEDWLGRHVADLLDDSKQQSGKRKERRHKQQQLVQHLRLLLKDTNQTGEACREVLDYLCRRLSSKHAIARLQALSVKRSTTNNFSPTRYFKFSSLSNIVKLRIQYTR